MTEQGCCFCGQITGDERANLLAPLLRNRWSRRPILLENPIGALMPSIGALVPGHGLICPKPHLRSFAAAPPEFDKGLDELTREAVDRLGSSLGQPVHLFEHGSSQGGVRIACSVEHAHLHLIPADVSIRSALADVARWTPVDTGAEALRSAVGRREYLVYQDPEGERLVATSDEGGFASQLLRRLFADALGNAANWNWRTHPSRANVAATVELFDGARAPLVTADA